MVFVVLDLLCQTIRGEDRSFDEFPLLDQTLIMLSLVTTLACEDLVLIWSRVRL
jgi:hypothetical protein